MAFTAALPNSTLRRVLLVTSVLIAGVAFGLSSAYAATIAASSPSRDDVAAAVAAAQDGDTVTIPAGNATWNTPLVISKGITLSGAGVGKTIVVEELTNDQPLIRLDTLASKSYRVTGIEFRNGSRSTKFQLGVINMGGVSNSIRVDHCHFYLVRNFAIRVANYARGVIDHNQFTADASSDSQFIHIWHQSWAGGQYGDKSWSEAIDWGGPDSLYIEDNLFVGTGVVATVTDTYAGARFVFRYNQLNNATLATHGTGDGAGRNRGLRQWEIYNNTWNASPATSKNAIHIRGGTGVCFNNVINGHTKFLTMHYYRFYSSHGKFSMLNGLSEFDINDPKGVYLSGTAASGSGENTLVVSNANWTPNQWSGYIVWVPESSTNPRGYFASLVLSNTANTITVKPGAQAATNDAERKIFANGERFEIRRVLLGLDQVGAGTSDLLTDSSNEPTPRPLHQVTDPVYAWNNTMSGVKDPIVAFAEPGIVEGVHWFSNTPRPAYQPYVYPHPLVSGTEPPASTTPPAAPSNARIASQ